MLSAIVRFSLRFRGVIIALACIFFGYGLYALARATYDVFPEFAPPQAVIQTQAPGLTPEQVEVLVTQPRENALNGLAGIESLRSGSIQGLSVITVTFHPSSDIFRDRQAVAERLASLTGQLPQGVQAPVITPLTSSTSVVLAVGLTADQRSLMELRTMADWTVKPRLLAVPGVAKVVVFGGEVRELQIQVNPDRLIQYNLALDDVLTAARQATGIRGAGFIESAKQRVLLHTQGQSLPPEPLATTVLRHQDGATLTLDDVAQVAEAPEPPTGAAAIMGKLGIILMLSAQYGANTVAVTQRIEQALEELHPTLEAQGVVLTPDLFRPATFIQTATDNVRSSLLIGAVLVMVVLSLFLCNVSGRDLSAFVADARTQILSTAALPPGSYVEFGGAATAQAQSTRDLLVHSVLAGIGIVVLLSMVMGHARNLCLVLINLPFALVGGVLAVFASGGGLSLGSLVGFVTLFGITLRNSIMLISHYEHLVAVEGVPWGLDAAIRGASERLTPILMTALVTALGLLPLAIGSGAPGREIEGPMALVILGGLITSTALNLLVLPTLAFRYGRFERPDQEASVS